MDQAVQKTSSIFDKGIQYLQSKKEEVLNLSPLEKKRQAAVRVQQGEKQTVEQQLVVQGEPEPEKDKKLTSTQDKGCDNKISVKKPRKVLSSVEPKGNVCSKEHERERSM